MKAFYLLLICSFAFFSCASSQQAISAEARQNIEKLRTLINLSGEQAQKLVKAETVYLNKIKSLKSSDDANEQGLVKLKQKRTQAFQKELSREQFIKFQAIDNNLIKQVPVRFDKN